MRVMMIYAFLSLVLLSCNDPSGPGPVPGPTPSVLTAEFRGWVPPDKAPRGVPLAVDLSWTICPDSDFVSYELYRSPQPGVASDPFALLMTTSETFDDTTFTDGTVDWETTWYYAVRTGDADTEFSWSNEDTVVVGSMTSYGGPDQFKREIAVGAGPAGICTSDLTDETYVACYFDNEVYVLGTPEDNFVVQTAIPVGSGPMDACTDDGSHVFVSCSGSNTVSVIDASSYAVITSISVGDHPVGLCYDPLRDVVLVSCYESDEVTVIDASSYSVTGSATVGDGPWDVCVSGNFAYTANRINGTVSVIDLDTYSVVTTPDTGSETRAVCALADGSEVWAADYSGDTVYRISTLTHAVEGSFATGSGPADMYALANGQMIYLSCFLEDRVDMIDPTSRAVMYTLVDGTRPLGVCETVDGAYVLVAGSAFSTVIVYEYDPYP